MGAFSTKDDSDFTNSPSVVKINGIQLPLDTLILLDDEKIIAESKILDGASIFEKVSRKPFSINFEFTIRQRINEKFDTVRQSATNTINTSLTGRGRFVFPQSVIENYIENIYKPDQVVKIENTYLNGIGITELIIKSATLTTIRGNTDVMGSLKCFENYNSIEGETLVIPL
jgi:hypothetical protein